jgi:WD40 repeat protein
MAILPNEKLLVGTNNGTIFIYDCNNINAAPQIVNTNQQSPVRAIAVFPNNEWVSANDNVLTFWDKEGNEVDALILRTNIIIYSVATIAQDTVAIGLNNNEIRIRNVKTGNQKTLSGHEGTVFSLSVFNNTLASGSLDRTIKIWDLKTTQLLATYTDHNSPVYSLHYIVQNDLLVSGSEDGKMMYWNVKDFRSIKFRVHPPQLGPVEAIIGCWNGVITGAMNGEIKSWQLVEFPQATARPCLASPQHQNNQQEVADVSPRTSQFIRVIRTNS